MTLPPPLIDNDSTSLDSSVRRTESNLTSSPILFSLPPPLSAGRRREGVLVGGATGYKSEPVSPMMSLHTTMLHNKSDIVASGNHPIRVSSGTSLDTMALSPLATIRHTPKGNPSNGGSGSVIPLAIAFQEICNAIYKGSDLSKYVNCVGVSKYVNCVGVSKYVNCVGVSKYVNCVGVSKYVNCVGVSKYVNCVGVSKYVDCVGVSCVCVFMWVCLVI